MSGAALEILGRVSLSAGVMILAAAALRLRFGGRTPGRVFCLLWDIILLRLLLPVDIPSPVSIQRLLAGGSGRGGAAAVTFVSGEVLAEGQYVVREKLPSLPSLDWTAVLLLLWAAGMVLGLTWLAAVHLRSRRIYAAALPAEDEGIRVWQAANPLRRPVQVRVSDRVASPLTYGAAYPVVVLPRGMDRDLLPCVLAHEYAHIRRFDALRKPLLALALCVHWFNPLVWAMYVLAGRDMELACDEAAVRAGADRRGYALALLSMEEERGRRPLSGSYFSANALEERIKGVMRGKQTTLAALLVVLVVMSAATTVFAAGAPAEGTGAVRLAEREVLLLDGNGQTCLSSDGGLTWMTEERYHAQYGDWGGDWDVEWWTYEEYKAWLDQEREELRDLIGERAYTGSDGWFTWDQEKVDDTIALYEEILEDIKNGGLYSRKIRDSSGELIPDMALSSGGTAPGDIWLEELRPFGIEGGGEELTYRGERIRTLVDGAPAGGGGYAVRSLYACDEGTVDVHTLRRPVQNPDGSYDPMGELTGLAAGGDPDFDPALIACARFEGAPAAEAAGADGGDRVGGRSLREIFTAYEIWGLTYGEDGSLAWNGQPVRSFADQKPGGGVFSYENPYADEGLRVGTVYDGGVLAGLTAA